MVDDHTWVETPGDTGSIWKPTIFFKGILPGPFQLSRCKCGEIKHKIGRESARETTVYLYGKSCKEIMMLKAIGELC